MSISPGMAVFKMAFQLSPIILTNGIANLIPGGMLPIVLITEALNFVDTLLTGNLSSLENLDSFFANFHPLPGSTLISQAIGKYPLANQQVAANAIIVKPLTISVRMICPVQEEAGYFLKLATMMTLQSALSTHNVSGGTYTILTPSFPYTNCVFLQMTDVSSAESKQAQNAYQMDFEQPLLTLQSIQQAQNNLMSQITAGTQINGAPSYSGAAPTVGFPPSLAAPSTVPGTSSIAGTSIASPEFAGPPV
jgi:hypothetical protein